MEPALRARRVGVLAVLALVALWPLAHRAIVARYDVNPWKLGGFAMYTTYRTWQVGLFDAKGKQLRPIDPRSLPVSARQAILDFRAQRSAIGTFARPTAMARAVFDARPDLDRMLVVVERFALDPETGRIAAEQRHHPFLREALSE